MITFVLITSFFDPLFHIWDENASELSQLVISKLVFFSMILENFNWLLPGQGFLIVWLFLISALCSYLFVQMIQEDATLLLKIQRTDDIYFMLQLLWVSIASRLLISDLKCYHLDEFLT